MTPQQARAELARRELARREEQRAAPQVQQTQAYGDPVVNEQGQYQVGSVIPGQTGNIREQVLGSVNERAKNWESKIGGMIEPVMSIGSGMVAQTVGQIGGGIAQVRDPNNPLSGPEARDRITNTMTYQPRSEHGQATMNVVGETMAPVGEAIESTRLGDEALEAGYPEWIARLAEGTPEYAGALLSLFGLRNAVPNKYAPMKTKAPPGYKGDPNYRSPLDPTKQPKVAASGRMEPVMDDMGQIKESLLKGEANPKAAKYKIDPITGSVIDDPLAKAALGQNWSDDVVSTTKLIAKDPPTRAKSIEMLRIARRGKKDPVWGVDNRPSDVLGASVMERYNALKKIQTTSGAQIDKVARASLKGNVDATPAFNQFRATIEKMGGKLNDKGKLEFDVMSDVYGQAKNQKNLLPVIERVEAMGNNPSALALHNTKRWLYDFVYNKNAGGKAGLTGPAEKAIKKLAADINEQLKGISTPYDKVNTAYSDAIGALDDMGSSLGKTLYGENADKAVGTTMRRVLGNPASRIPISNSVKNADKILKKYNITFKDDISSQALFANALDDYITTPTNRTTFLAKGGAKVAEALEKSKAANMRDVAGEVVNKVFGKSDEAALNALEDLLRSSGKANK